MNSISKLSSKVKNHKKKYIKFISLREPWSSVESINKTVDYIFKLISWILEENEILNLSFEKIEINSIILFFKKKFETNIWFLKCLKKEGWFSINIDLWKYCEHHCSHCAIEGAAKEEKIDIETFLKGFDNTKNEDFSRLVKEITFHNSWELLDYENFEKIFEYFLERWINNFSLITRWPKKQDINEVYKKIYILKEKYKEFNLMLTLSFDDYSCIDSEKNLENLIILFKFSKNIFKAKFIETNWIIENLEIDYNLYFIKLYNFLENLWISRNNIKIEIGKNKLINKVILTNWFEIYINIQWMIPFWRRKSKERLGNNNRLFNYSDCSMIFNPFSFSIDKNWNIKVCTNPTIRSVNEYNLWHISDPDFFWKLIEIKRNFLLSATFEDILWKSWKTHCLAKHLLL